ncbi:hypothetical protein HDU97_005056 [Phlyctochytrium planicorne]|nr:hypothetical protein HDU97_005056 [Phlyctochytrium planicorne]
MLLDLDLDNLDVGIRRRSRLLLSAAHASGSHSDILETTKFLIGSSAYALRKFQSHVRFVMGSLTLFEAGMAEEQSERDRLEAKALMHFKKSLNGGPGEAVTAVAVLGFFNEFGMGGLEVDYREAERLYTEAANQGCGFAQARLAFLKTHGRPNIKINHTEADKWRNACKAQTTNRSSSSSSSSSSETPVSSIAWLKIAAEAKVPAAQFCIALCYYNGIAVPSNDKEAFRWCELAALQGHPGAQNVLGNLYIEGTGCAVNATAGLRWYIRAAEKKEAAAIYNIGTLFERGLAVEEDPVQAFEWYVRASVFGSVNAQNVLGIFHEQGIGVHQNPARAVYYYRTAALSGHPHAQYNLGRCYHDGFGVQADDSLAVMWFRMGAEQGHSLSLLSMAVSSEAGIGVPIDPERAMAFYRKAATRDSFEAKRRLGPVVALSLLAPARALLSYPLRCHTPTRSSQGSRTRGSLWGGRRRVSYSLGAPSASPLSSRDAFPFSLSIPTSPSTTSPISAHSSTSTNSVSPSSYSSLSLSRGTNVISPTRLASTFSSLSLSAYANPYTSSYLDAFLAASTAFPVSPSSRRSSISSLAIPNAPPSTPSTLVTPIADSYFNRRRASSLSAVDPAPFLLPLPESVDIDEHPVTPTTPKSSLTIADLPVEILLHILTFLDDLKILSKAQFRTAINHGAERRTLVVSPSAAALATLDDKGGLFFGNAGAGVSSGVESGVGRNGFLRKLGLPVFKRSCSCVGECRKIKHYITMLEDSSEEGAETDAF